MIRPFSCGTQYIDWQNRNCCRCAKYDYDQENERVICDCEIEYALAISDGTVSDEIGKRMGYKDPLEYTWDCPERIDEVKGREPENGRTNLTDGEHDQ